MAQYSSRVVYQHQKVEVKLFLEQNAPIHQELSLELCQTRTSRQSV